MHGRQRVELTPEEEAKKQKERQSKVASYQFAMKKIFGKRSNGELDAEMLAIVGQVLALNPDIATLWNIRKETLLKMKESEVLNFVDTIVPKELDFSEFCLKNNPKSYGAWYHRYWLMQETEFKRVVEELKLISKYLEYDDRNFHCWDYRRFLLDNCSLITLEEELQFTTEKISTNFSNFSSWHLRSKLLPQLSKSYLQEELDLIRNAAFTDPKDQSSWLYHMWLLKSRLEKDSPKLVCLQMTNAHLLACFNVPVPVPSKKDLTIAVPHEAWKSPLSTSRSKLWMINLTDIKDTEKEISVSGDHIQKLFNRESKLLKFGLVYGEFDPYFDEETKPKTPEFEKLLRDELTWVEELQELEPEIKWPIHTAMTLMRMINFIEFKQRITDCLSKLLKIDPKRTNYYNDLRSKFILEWILVDKSGRVEIEVIDLGGLHLTSLYYSDRLCYYKIINCSDNKLRQGVPLSAFISCNNLNISNNQIPVDNTLIKLLQGLPDLEYLVVSGNPDCDFSFLSNEFANSVIIS